MMWMEVDTRSQTPVYEQVIDGIKTAIARGVFSPGEKVPSIRELAVELTLNPNTVAKAYQELEREQVIEVIRGRGTYVTEAGQVPNREERIAEIRETMHRLFVEAHHLRISESHLVVMFEQVAREWRDSHES